ncbi:MAG: purine-nucleoside phosphorylase [Clostridia bacterium]|nr:purine-nucleoside phosphorylase [Clostridia bacterium]
MMKVKNCFSGEAEKKAYVTACENEFEARLEAVCEEVCAIEGLQLIGLSGPTCSGKTTTANKLIDNLSRRGKTVHIISIDDFYYDREFLTRRAERLGIEVDYDSIDTIDFEALRECVREVFTHDKTLVPRYDFQSGKRSGYTEYEYDDNDLFIFEGIQVVYPEISALFREHPYRSIYICVEEGIEINGVTFSPEEIRFMRRMVRDYNFRSAEPEFTYFLWESVRANEEKNIYPYADDCDIRINSTMPYDLNMLIPYLLPLLKKIPADDEHKAAAEQLIAKLDEAGICPISSAYIAENSLYREFLKPEVSSMKKEKATIEQYRESAEYLRGRIGRTPDIAVVLGSGLGAFADTLTNPIVIPYREIPHFPVSTVSYQKGEMVIGTRGDKLVLAMNGRFHFYEGWEMWQAAYYVGVLKLLGVSALIITNAAGGVNESLRPGDIVCVRDHIKLTAQSPMRGVNIPEFGPRFFDMQRVYDPALAELAHSAAKAAGFSLTNGVYAFMSGPQYETPAEIRMLRLLGADVVGMSTVPEIIAAAQCGISVLCLSAVTNMAAGITGAAITEEEVLETGAVIRSRFVDLLSAVVEGYKGAAK